MMIITIVGGETRERSPIISHNLNLFFYAFYRVKGEQNVIGIKKHLLSRVGRPFISTDIDKPLLYFLLHLKSCVGMCAADRFIKLI